MIRWIAMGLVLVLVGLAAAAPAVADTRVALVVGNGAYRHVSPLDNPVNDARLMAQTLRTLGFTLVGGSAQLDLDKSALDAAVQAFGAALQGADVGLFYYAGHGVQVRGANFLVPVGANPVREADIDFQMLDTALVLRQMEAAGTRLNLVILDACRNNPFGGRGLRSTSSGLAQMQAPEGTLISFATQPGNVALDGAAANSPYTAALAQTVRRSGLDIFQTFNEVGLAVKRATAGAQQPWVSSSPIAGTFYFAGTQAEPPPAAPPTPPVGAAAAVGSDAERAWAVTKDTTSIAVLEDFVRQFGPTPYGSMARARLDELRRLSSRRPETATDVLEVVRQFYEALGNANGFSASALVIPEKQASGPFSADAITRFYSSLAEPLRIKNMSAIGSNQVLVEYRYSKNRSSVCDGSAIVTLVNRNGMRLIEGIKALRGC